MKPVAIIDCAQKEHEHINFNRLVTRTGRPMTYHAPNLFGRQSMDLVTDLSAIIIFGSASNVDDHCPWHRDVIEFVMTYLSQGIPTFGICFGHQLMAHHFGCDVGWRSEDHSSYRAPRDIRFVDSALGFKTGESVTVALSHAQEVKTISDSLVHMATSDGCRYEGLRHKTLPFWSTQCHPEVSENYLHKRLKLEDPALIQRILSNGDRMLDGFLSLSN